MTPPKIGWPVPNTISLHQTKNKCFMEEELIEEVVEKVFIPGPLTVLLQIVPSWILSIFIIAFSFIPWTWRIMTALYDVKLAGAVSPNVWYAGFKISLFVITLGMIVFLISRIIIAIQTTRN